MKIAKYKQYLVDDCKTICALAFDGCSGYDGLSVLNPGCIARDECRTMFISDLSLKRDSSEHDAPELDLGDFVVQPDYDEHGEQGYPNRYNFYSRYIQVLLGKLPGWALVRVDISLDALEFYFVTFNDQDLLADIGCIEMKYPPHLSMCIDLENYYVFDPDKKPMPHPDFIRGPREEPASYLTPGKYIITVDSKPQGQPEICVSEYALNVLQRTSRISRDDKGTYELITEA